MDIQHTLKSTIQKGFKTLYDVEIDSVEFQSTRKDFKGDITIVIFPFLRVIKGNPVEIANNLGNYIKENVIEIQDFNVVKGFLNLELSNTYFLNKFKEIYVTKSFGIKSHTSDWMYFFFV